MKIAKKRKKYLFWISENIFPYMTMIGNVHGKVCEFLEYIYLDLEKHLINYANSFSSLIQGDKSLKKF